ncbi:MAG: LTA synthase family protein [Polyangiales bacterium]
MKDDDSGGDQPAPGRAPWARACVALVVAPVSSMLVQKGLRVAASASHDGNASFGRCAYLLLPDLLFGAGAAAVSWVALSAWRARRSRVVALITLQCAWACVLFAGTASHRYFLTTHTPLDYPMFWLGVVELRERARVVSSEIPVASWLVHLAALLCIALLPWWPLRRRPGSRAAPSPSRLARPAAHVGWVAMGVAGVAASALLPPPAGVGHDFMRPAVVQLFATVPREDPVSAALLSEARAAARGARSLTASTDSPPSRPNVLFILLESTGASATTPYAPSLTTTPALARWAEHGTLVETAYAVVPHTSKALVAILCGFPPRVGVRIAEALPHGLPGRCLPDLLRERGYATAFMQSAVGSFEQRGSLVAALGYDRFEHSETLPTAGFERTNYFAYEDDILRAPARAFLEAQRDSGEPFVLTLLTGATHHDYREVQRYGTETHDPDHATRNRWLNAVRRQDHFMGGVLSDLVELGLLEDTVVVIVGDHGEAFGEHGLRTHDEVPYDEVLHVPLLLLDGRAPGRVRGPVTQLDLVPTVLDRLGLEPIGGRYDGRAIGSVVDAERRIYAACYHELRCAVEIEGHRKRIHRYGTLPDQVFDLAADPSEHRDLVATGDPTVLAEASEASARSTRWVRLTTLMSQATEGIRRAIDAARVSALPADAHVVTGRFGDTIRVLGSRYPSAPTHRDGFVEFTVYYEVLRAPPSAIRLIQTGRGRGPAPIRFTHTPVNGLYPAALWRPGEIIADTFRLRVPRRHPDDFMDVGVAFHTADGSTRLPLTEGEGREPDELFVGRVPIGP